MNDDKRYCNECGRTCLEVGDTYNATIIFHKGTTQVGGSLKRPHVYLCDDCRNADNLLVLDHYELWA